MTVFDGISYIEVSRLAAFGADTAKKLGEVHYASPNVLIRAIGDCEKRISKCRDAIERSFASGRELTPECEWIDDNAYLVYREAESARSELKNAEKLRCTENGQALIYVLCRSLICSGAGRLEIDRLTSFLNGYQQNCELMAGEVLLIPAAARAAVISLIAEECARLVFSETDKAGVSRLEALFTTLRSLPEIDIEELVASVCVCDMVLRRDPTGEYKRMNVSTRYSYLKRVAELARKGSCSERETAEAVINRAIEENRHVGLLLFSEKPKKASGYIAANILLSLFFSLLTGFACGSLPASLLLLIPVSELVKRSIDGLMLEAVHPKHLPSMNVAGGIPPEGRSVCVISALLTDEVSAELGAKKLEELRLLSGNSALYLTFGLLADLPVAENAETEADARLIACAEEAIDKLNAKYGGGFCLFTRPRRFNGEHYSGHERKRGALVALARLLCGKDSEMRVFGDAAPLKDAKYIITLDSDTRVYPGSIEALIGSMLHPLCKAVIDSEKHVVTSGYGIIHPRIDTELLSACENDFALIYAGAGGCDPYGCLCGELYMDAFDCGGFAGKGIIDAKALLDCTEDFPEGRILSHDALEGAFLRGGYAGDVQFSDSFPSSPFAYFRRLHRWTRGDWQNSPWIFRRGKALRSVDRWRLFDSLRRSLVSPAVLFALLFGIFAPDRGTAAAAFAAVLCLLSELISTLTERQRAKRLRRYSRLLTGTGGAIVRFFISLWLLPYSAWISASAIVCSLWRMLISNKRLLQWETAAQVGKKRAGLWAYCREMWFASLVGAAALIFSPLIIGRALGLLWLLSPAAAAALSLKAYSEPELSESDKEWLVDRVKESWHYFSRLGNEKNNYIPPDNYQVQPPTGAADRASPTNIGLALASAAAVCELGIISPSAMAEYTERIVSTLERMPKALGHYFNWYDTQTLRPMKPEYVSAVDSGNLCACLGVSRFAAAKHGYTELAKRIEKISAAMSFAPLYDGKSGLLYISYDVRNDRPSKEKYDLMASEAMLTSYIAVSRGDVPIEHWKKLSRAQLRKNGYRGLASWSGSMFEYLMPELFLPLYRGSLLYESARFCVYAQKKRNTPWGISESAYASLDRLMTYKYKAHGVQSLALKKGMDSECVISPYSSFLALVSDPVGAVSNLRRLEALGAVGRFGFIEALDYTPSRMRDGAPRRVDCHMIHHTGMSILAAANAIKKDCVRDLFLSEPCMSAHTLFLQELLPDSADALKLTQSSAPHKPEAPAASWKMSVTKDDKESFYPLSNGVYNIMSTSYGRTEASLRDTAVYRDGISVSLNGETLLPSDEAECIFTEANTVWLTHLGAVSAKITAGCAFGDWGEFRRIELMTEKDMSAEISVELCPILAPEKDYVNHTPYQRLGIYAAELDGMLLLRRLAKGAQRELWLCAALSSPARYSADESGSMGWLLRPRITAYTSVKVQKGERVELTFALALAPDRDGAAAAVRRILSRRENECGAMLTAAASRLRADNAEITKTVAILSKIKSKKRALAPPSRELWRFGISGELPVISCRIDEPEAERLLYSFLLLSSCGVEAELVFLTGETDSYNQPARRRLEAVLCSLSLEALIGAPGGVFFVGREYEYLIRSASVFAPDARLIELPDIKAPKMGFDRTRAVPEFSAGVGVFRFSVKNTLPARPWQNILTNGSFGYIATDCGSGYMWLQNAREQALTPPPADESSAEGAEALWIELNGRAYSLFAANDGLKCTLSYYPGRVIWKKDFGGFIVETEAYIPDGTDARVFVIRGLNGMRMRWLLRPSFAESSVCSVKKGVCTCEYREYASNVRLSCCSFPAAEFRTGFAPAAMLAEINCSEVTVLAAGTCSAKELTELCKPDKVLMLKPTRLIELICRFSMRSSEKAMDRYMDSWCICQTVSCRLEGRASLYQRGGAIGFRDQLQDAVNLLLIDSTYARERILDCCAHQYVEGDVMHWWHGETGLRTRCSDDLLWLPWALCEYVSTTGDVSLCSESVPFIDSALLAPEEKDRYERPAQTASATVLEHAERALELCIARGFGSHGLPLILGGDWNDAMNTAGGESVWLGWFLCRCSKSFSELLEKLCKPKSRYFKQVSDSVLRACERSFNGRFFPRGFLENGSITGGESRMDSVSQSWAAFCGAENAGKAVKCALCKLVDRDHGLVRLLWPPYSPEDAKLGYIVSYGQGIRENGGQYTHAAIWLAMACFEVGLPNEGYEILCMLLPEKHDIKEYLAEPFVLPADVCSLGDHVGEAGWTWYTGSAGWYFRAVTHSMLGMSLIGGRLVIEPHLPDKLSELELRWMGREITVKQTSILLDGKPWNGEPITPDMH